MIKNLRDPDKDNLKTILNNVPSKKSHFFTKAHMLEEDIPKDSFILDKKKSSTLSTNTRLN